MMTYNDTIMDTMHSDPEMQVWLEEVYRKEVVEYLNGKREYYSLSDFDISAYYTRELHLKNFSDLTMQEKLALIEKDGL